MPQKKRQHYVPKFYMKAFANQKKQFSVFNIKDKSTHFPVPYDTQCYANYFYGENAELENRLSILENIWNDSLNSARTNSSLSANDIRRIKEFAVFQRQRTLAESEYGKQEKVELYIEYGKSICAKKGLPFGASAQKACTDYALGHAPSPAKVLKYVETIVPLIEDLEFLIIEYKTQACLISSDVPIILINPFCQQQIGFGCMGLIILFPISPHRLVVLYDAKMYPRYKGKSYISLSNEKEVYNLNTLQLISAEKILFGYDSAEFCKFRPQAFQARSRNREADKVNRLGTEEHKLLLTSMRKAIYDCPLSFGKVRSDFDTIHLSCREAAPRLWDKGWEDKLREAGGIIRQLSKKSNSPLKATGISGKEYYRERKKLLQCALAYWSE